MNPPGMMNTAHGVIASAEALLRAITPPDAKRRVETGIPVPPKGAYVPPLPPPAYVPPFDAGWLVEAGSRAVGPFMWWRGARDYLLEHWWGQALLFTLYAGATFAVLGIALAIVGLYLACR
jgi:hypothetical protein